MTTSTIFLLLAEFGTGHIPLDRCSHYFGMKQEEANRRALRQQLPVPVFRLGSQKSPWLVAADVLAQYIDKQRDGANEEHQKLQKAG